MKRRTFIRSAVVAAAAVALPRHDAVAGFYRVARQRAPEVEAVTGDGKTVVLTSDSIEALAARLHGRLLLAGDDGYESARQILNPSFDKRPALIAQVTGPADIALAVDFAREHGGLLLAVKCGGHSFSGKSTCDRGMMIDLSRFRAVRVDPAARRAWVTGGSLLGQVDHETMKHGLVTPLGTVSHTGAGGLVTGGGFGRVGRRYGLSVDNLVSVDVITADGQLRRASETENPDLFWGVRGGGGNFGVVTNFEFRLHPMQRQVLGGYIAYPLTRAKEVLALYADYAPIAPDELQLDFIMVQPPGGEAGSIAFGICYSGPPEAADRALAPLRRLGGAALDNVEAVDYVALQRSTDVDDPRAQGVYLKSGFVPSIPTNLIAEAVEGFEGRPDRHTALFAQQGGGAVGRVPPHATAFAQRDALCNLLSVVGWRMGDEPGEHIEWMRQYWARLERYTHGFYVNDLEPDITAQAIQENYRENHQRLVAVKNRYDPTNLFRLNANVLPSG